MCKEIVTPIVLIAIIINSILFLDCQELNNDKLIFAHVIFRHGNRTPIETYPSDPWKDPSNWEQGWGQLTNVGKRTHYYLGQWLRNRYKDLINETYSPDDIYVQSSAVDRVMMSALSNLAGLYPPKGKDLWLPSILWQPIPVHQIAKSMDNIIAVTRECDTFQKLLQQYTNSSEYQAYNRSIEPILDYATLHSGKTFESIISIYDLYSCLDIEHENGYKLPNWTEKIYPEPLRSISAETLRIYTNTTEMARLIAGPMIKDILMRFQQKVDNTLVPNRRMWIYSGHDTSIVNLLNTLGLFKPHNPPFAACVMLELRIAPDGSPYVSVYYKDNINDPEALNVPNCGTRCPLKTMFELYQAVIPMDWEEECKNS